jgi:hypothetical protein
MGKARSALMIGVRFILCTNLPVMPNIGKCDVRNPEWKRSSLAM